MNMGAFAALLSAVATVHAQESVFSLDSDGTGTYSA